MNFKVLWWYIKHPKYYPDLVSLIKRKIGKVIHGAYEVDKKEVEKWCKEHLVSHNQVFEEFLGRVPERTFEEAYEGQLLEAKKREENCPVNMGGPGNLNLIYQLCKGKELYVETGVAYGWSSLAALLSCKKVISVDFPYPGLNNEKYVGVVVADSLKKNWELIRYPDSQALPKLLKKYEGKVDVVHYDSDKSYLGKMNSYPKLWQMLKSGGIFISDDIGNDFGFRDFCKQIDVKPKVVYAKNDYIGVVRK